MLIDIYHKWTSIKLMYRIALAVLLGAALAVVLPNIPFLPLLGELFVGALKALAPFLILFLVIAALSKSSARLGDKFRVVIILYAASTLIAAMIAVAINLAFPITVTLQSPHSGEPVSDLETLLSNVIRSLVDNPIASLTSGNYLGIIFWSIFAGVVVRRYATDSTKDMIEDVSNILTRMITVVIQFAPFGIFGLVYSSVSKNSIGIFGEYAQLILALAVAVAIVMFVTNPILVYLAARRNPYPLLFRCLKVSGVTAFFTRSSAANIPVNMGLARDMKLDIDFCSVSIPLGATINMSGAAITVSTMTLAAATTVGIHVEPALAIILCVVASVAACGASGVAGGSLLLIPLACSLFGISNDIAMEMVAIGFIIGVIQDSMETALNSSSDVLFSAAADMRARPDAQFDI